eukprot:1889367-Alexandrium_andersonii.AAC.1
MPLSDCVKLIAIGKWSGGRASPVAGRRGGLGIDLWPLELGRDHSQGGYGPALRLNHSRRRNGRNR